VVTIGTFFDKITDKWNTVKQLIEEKPYHVKQKKNGALGYEVIEFGASEFPSQISTFFAYKVEMPDNVDRHPLRLVDEEGNVIKGSIRNLRTI